MNTVIKTGTLTKIANTVSRNLSRTVIRTGSSNSFKVQDDKDFLEKVENSKEPVIVDFFATWCGPCKTLEPRLANVLANAKRQGKISLAKVDIDSMGEVAAKYEVASIPALVVFRNGKVEERLVGLQDEDKLGIWIDKVIENK